MDEFKNILTSMGKYIAKQRKDKGELTKEEIALHIRKYRIDNNNMSIEELARKLNVPRMQIYRWENARNKPTRVMQDILRRAGIIG